MRSDVVIVATPKRSPRLQCTGGIAVRRTAHDTVYLVSTAATPLGGDSINLRVVVEAGARLRIRTAAATVSLPGAGTVESHATWTLDVAGELDLDPQPTIVAATSRHYSTTTLALEEGGRVHLRERVQIGRTGERQGFWSGALRADLGGKPLLRHRVELGNRSLADDAIAAPRACVSQLHFPRCEAPCEVSTDAVALELAGGGCLTTWQGDAL